MTVPARHVLNALASYNTTPDRYVFQYLRSKFNTLVVQVLIDGRDNWMNHLVDGVSHVRYPIGVRRPVVENKIGTLEILSLPTVQFCEAAFLKLNMCEHTSQHFYV